MAEYQANIYSDNEPTKKKSHKKRWLILLLALLLLIGVGGGVTAAILTQDKTPDTVVRVVFDPVKISADDKQTHLNNAERFTVKLDGGADEHTQAINESLNQGEYIRFSYEITNNGPSTVGWALDLDSLENTGFKVQFRLGDFGELTDFNSGEQIFNSLAAGATANLWVYFSVEDAVNSSISGALVLTISIA